MFKRLSLQKLLLGGLCLLMAAGCGHRQGSVVASPVAVITPTTAPTTLPTMLEIAPSVHHYVSTPPAIEFDYPADWGPDKAQTACFAICAPKSAGPGYSSLSLDIPKLPWHLPGMITVGMVASGYEQDLKKNQIHDAVVKDECPITVCGTAGRKIMSVGHEDGNPSFDIAIILIHSDHVYILSADSDEAGLPAATKTLDAAVASLKWTK